MWFSGSLATQQNSKSGQVDNSAAEKALVLSMMVELMQQTQCNLRPEIGDLSAQKRFVRSPVVDLRQW